MNIVPIAPVKINPLGKSFPTLGCAQFWLVGSSAATGGQSAILLVDCKKPDQPVVLGLLALNRFRSVLYSWAKHGYGPLLYDVGAQYRGEVVPSFSQSEAAQYLWARLHRERGSAILRPLNQQAFVERYGDSFDTLRSRGEAALDVTDTNLLGLLWRQAG